MCTPIAAGPDDLGDEITKSGAARRNLLNESGVEAVQPTMRVRLRIAVFIALLRHDSRERHLPSDAILGSAVARFARTRWCTGIPLGNPFLDYCRYSANPVGRTRAVSVAAISDAERQAYV